MKRKSKRKNSALKRKSRANLIAASLIAEPSVDQKKEKLFQCWCCLKTFKEESSRRQHMRLHDPSLLTFPCNPCMLLFASRIAYNNHMKTEHQESSPDLNEPIVFGDQSFSSVEQKTWNNKNIGEPGMHNELNHSTRNSSVSSQNDSELRIASTFSLREMAELWPVGFIDINTNLENIERQQLPNSRNRFNDNERIQDQQKQAYCPSRTLKDCSSNDVTSKNNNDADFCDLTLDSDEDHDDDEGSAEEISIHDVNLVEDVCDEDEDNFTANKKRK